MTNELISYRRPGLPASGDPGDFLAEYKRRLAVGTPGRMAWRGILDQLPTESKPGTGHLYVALFADGVVKIGQTINARQRIEAHLAEATSRRNTELEAFWLSVPFVGRNQAEAVLIDMLAATGEQLGWRGEYFAGLDFDKTVEIADQVVGAQIATTQDQT